MATTSLSEMHLPALPVRRISIEAPGRWLVAGWHDFCRAPLLSLAYGVLFVVAGYAIVIGLYNAGLASLIPTAVAGFFLVAPILAVGLYEISRRFERNEPVSWKHSLQALKRNPGGLSSIGLVLILCLAAWMQIALLIFMLFFHEDAPGLDHFFHDILTAPQAPAFLAVGTIVGYGIATAVFAISAVSIPLLLDRDAPVLAAIGTSVAAVRENWLVMFAWAATIVFLVGLGLACFFLGLAVALPLVAYATWHAYRDTVG